MAKGRKLVSVSGVQVSGRVRWWRWWEERGEKLTVTSSETNADMNDRNKVKNDWNLNEGQHCDKIHMQNLILLSKGPRGLCVTGFKCRTRCRPGRVNFTQALLFHHKQRVHLNKDFPAWQSKRERGNSDELRVWLMAGWSSVVNCEQRRWSLVGVWTFSGREWMLRKEFGLLSRQFLGLEGEDEGQESELSEVAVYELMAGGHAGIRWSDPSREREHEAD